MRRTQIITAIAAFVLAALPTLAQPASAQSATADQTAAAASAIPADQQATKEQIEKLFDVMQLHKQMEAMMNMMPGLVEQSFREQMKSLSEKLPSGLSSENQAALEKVMSKYVQKAMTAYPIDEMIADAVPVYQRHISRDDANAVIAFYSSPAGQRLLAEQPAIMREYMAVLMPRMQERSKALTDEMEAEIQQIVKPQQSAPDKAPAQPE